MAVCRVYLTTYRRNEMLRRAVNSLLAQTCQDWVCELHNDDPADPYPGILAAELADPRITYHPHSQNLGPVRSFNLFFRPIAEPFFSILEDDNWWEPRLLETLLRTLADHPDADLAWSNMRLWQEDADGAWTDTGRDIWDRREHPEPTTFRWPDVRQFFAGIHSNGAMVVRCNQATARPVPASTPFNLIEPVRERLYTGAMVLVPEVLAHFALTRKTAQHSDVTEKLQIGVLLAVSFLRRVETSPKLEAEIWRLAQGWPVRSSNTLIIAGLLVGRWQFLIRNGRLFDWLFFIASCLKRPRRIWKCFRAAKCHPEVASFLDEVTPPFRASGPAPC